MMTTMKNVSNLKKELYSRSLADKVAKDTAQFNLREAYKPLLKGQKKTSQAQMRQQQNLHIILQLVHLESKKEISCQL